MKLFLTFAFSFIMFLAFNPQVQAQTVDEATGTPVVDSETQPTTVETAELTTKTVAIKVKGVGCGSDIALIRANVEKLAGVEGFEVVKHGAVSSFDVTYNPETADMDAIHKAIEGTGCCKDPDARPYKVKL